MQEEQADFVGPTVPALPRLDGQLQQLLPAVLPFAPQSPEFLSTKGLWTQQHLLPRAPWQRWVSQLNPVEKATENVIQHSKPQRHFAYFFAVLVLALASLAVEVEMAEACPPHSSFSAPARKVRVAREAARHSLVDPSQFVAYALLALLHDYSSWLVAAVAVVLTPEHEAFENHLIVRQRPGSHLNPSVKRQIVAAHAGDGLSPALLH